MPQNPFIVATKSPSADVYIFDVSKHPSMPRDSRKFRPEHICKGHTREGYGLAWNPTNTGLLLSGSDDSCICLWDAASGGKELGTYCRWAGHADVIEDVAWHSGSPHVFGSVGDDRLILLWDARKPREAVINIPNAHAADVNSITFNPLHEFIVGTGAADHLVKIWDLRNTSCALWSLRGHDKEVLQVQWAPFDASVLASCGADRRVRMWDVCKVGISHASPHSSEREVESMFIHGGHTGQVSELNWNSNRDWVVASVSDDNLLQIWKPVCCLNSSCDRIILCCRRTLFCRDSELDA